MHPTLCTFGPFSVYSYGLMLAIAFSVSTYLAMRAARSLGIAPDLIYSLCLVSVIGGLAGARLLYALEHHAVYLKNPLELFMLQHGGLSWFGGLIAGSAAGLWYLRARRAPVPQVLDCMAPFLALGHAIGRLGCFLNGCCYGRPVSRLGVYFPVHAETLFPTQLLSAALLVAIALLLRTLLMRPHRRGDIFYLYLLLYGLKRFGMEFLRGDTHIVIFGLTFFQLFSIPLCILAAALLAYNRSAVPLER